MTSSFQDRPNQFGIVLFSLGRTGENVVGAGVGMEVATEGVGVLGAEVGLNAAQGEVHHGEAAGGFMFSGFV